MGEDRENCHMTALSVLNDWRLERGLTTFQDAQLPNIVDAPYHLVMSVYQEWWKTREDAREMMWFLASKSRKHGSEQHRAVVTAACACAVEATILLPKNKEASVQAIKVAREWVQGQASPEEVHKAVKIAKESSVEFHNRHEYAQWFAAIACMDAAKCVGVDSIAYTANAAHAASYGATTIDCSARAFAHHAARSNATNKWIRKFQLHVSLLANVIRMTIPWKVIEVWYRLPAQDEERLRLSLLLAID